ncbi:DTW domain-containing protein 1-like [Ctenocephalides felis]|uniref:DTW domain-containing protein 1-like n=1 Tax=Ctenocephalides felis TaxID=7515 RepID=UPI000E6E46AB|nr:DTW domain-containing protein 1-like [Ctenocephalides felis]
MCEEIKNIDSNPFYGMKIDDASILNRLEGRSPCPKCGKSRKYFCYTCYVPVKELEGLIPKLKLPLKIDIIKHKREIDGKSTAIHAAILASNDVQIYTYPDIPNYTEEEKTVLIFPSATSVPISDIFNDNYKKRNPDEGLQKGYHYGTMLRSPIFETITDKNQQSMSELPITKAVFIDSTWSQSRGIYQDYRIQKLKCVVLQNRISQFWRYQKGSPRWYLATIEAIHQFLLELHILMWGVSDKYLGLQNLGLGTKLEHYSKQDVIDNYTGQYDNLLFFFKHMYDIIHKLYEHDALKSYKRPIF